MKADVVADVGNSRVKWGRCAPRGVAAVASLPPNDPAAWQARLDEWGLSGSLSWAVAGVHPARLDALVDWLRGRGDAVWVASRYDQLPLEVRAEPPERVGVDRLLNAVAANARLGRGPAGRRQRAAVLIDAGTAVTVDLRGPDGAFLGGAIFPGRRLMAQALHDYTALLPLVIGDDRDPPAVGVNTAAAIEAGVLHAVAGGINQLVRYQINGTFPRASHPHLGPPAIFLTGGDAPLLKGAVDRSAVLWPEMTLEGLRLSAEAAP